MTKEMRLGLVQPITCTGLKVTVPLQKLSSPQQSWWDSQKKRKPEIFGKQPPVTSKHILHHLILIQLHKVDIKFHCFKNEETNQRKIR